MTNIIATVGTSLTLDDDYPGEVFQIGKPIPQTSGLVVHYTGVISSTMNIDTLSVEMDRAARLLDVGHLASADFPNLQDEIWQLLKDYQAAVIQTNLTMGQFALKTEEVLGNLLQSMTYLVEAKFSRSILIAQRCVASARELSTAAEAIAKVSQDMADAAATTVKNSQNQKTLSRAASAALQTQLQEIMADFATQKSLANSYELQKQHVQQLYEKALSDAETADTRAFVSELVGGLFKAVGQGLATYAAARMPSLNIGGLGTVLPTQDAAKIFPAPKAAPGKAAAAKHFRQRWA